MTTAEKLERIKSKCRGVVVSPLSTELEIAMAESTIAAIAAMEKISKPALGGKFQQYEAQDALESILSAWPEELL